MRKFDVRLRNAAAWLGALACVVACGSGGKAGPSGEPPEDSTPGECDGTLTDFRGDCFALEPPDADEGFQLHYGPSEYTPDAMERFLLMPGEEVVDCLYMTTPNAAEVFFQKHQIAARSGTHHVIVWADAANEPDGTLAECPLDGGGDSKWLIWTDGALGVDGNLKTYPPEEGLAPEDVGNAYRLGPYTKMAFQSHFVNTGEEPLLRESWANIYYSPRDAVSTVVDTLAFIGGVGMNIPPHTRGVEDASCTVPESLGPVRVVNLSGHMHSHGERFTVWKSTASEGRSLVYETFDWAEPDLLEYNSVQINPPPDRARLRGGGHSGVLMLNPGDRLEWQCEFDNRLDIALRWANEAYTAEMCNLIGMYSPSQGRPWQCLN